jgi:O-antigen/teichoic acid export membrane protein
MNVYAAIGILDVVLKLIIALLISTSPIDKLIFYGGLLMLVVLMNFLIYFVYCHRNFEETRYHFYWDKKVFKSIFSFASWTIVGQGAMIGANQGTSILVNMFHTVRANAAMGVAAQVNSALSGLTSHFYIAYQPQITKAYSSRDYDYMSKLLLGASKLSFLLVFVVSIPILYNLDAILKIWLGGVPEDTSIFCFLFIISSMINALGNPFLTGVYATGSIKQLQLVSTGLYILDLVIIFVLFKIGFPAYWGPAAKVLIDIMLTTTRVLYAKKLLDFFSIRTYLKRVLLPLFVCVVFVVGIIFVSLQIGDSVVLQLIKTFLIFVLTLLFAYYVGLNKNERLMANNVLKSFTSRFKS